MTVARPASRDELLALLQRHDRPGPRYTSYPTAVEFHDGVGRADYEARLAAADSNRGAPLSIYVHLPFCEHRCLFCGCNVIVLPQHERARPYLDLLAREIDLLAARLPRRRAVAQLHLGGGTPTYHPPADLEWLCAKLRAAFPPLPDAELAVEVDPRVTSPEQLRVLAAAGFNRLSMGVQDFDPAVQHAVERDQSFELTAGLIAQARRLGFRGINVDLIHGLPFQTPATFERTIEQVVALEVDRVAVYSFAYVPWKGPHQKNLDPAELPPAEIKLALAAIARERLLAAGFEPIGMDHFARPQDELARARRAGRLRRNFQGYTVLPASDVVGLGISAIGDVAGGYFQNTKKLSVYQREVEAGRLPVERGLLRGADDELRRAVIGELMCNFTIDVQRVERDWGIDFATRFAGELAQLAELQRDGLVTVAPERIDATPAGELFVRRLAMCFDRYLPGRSGDRPVFSRTI